MIIPDGTNQYFSNLAQAFQNELSKRNCTLIVVDSNSNNINELNNINLLESINVDGLIFISVGDNGKAFMELNSYNEKPILILDREIPIENADFLINHDTYGIFEAVRYLKSQNHRKIAFIKGDFNTEPGRVRYASFIEACNELSIDLIEDFIFEGDFMIGSGIMAASKILQKDNRPSAIISSNDIMAIGCLFELQRRGFEVPKDFSIIGYDDITFSSWIYPSLTTIKQDVLELAKSGTELLFNRDNNLKGEKKVKVIKPELIIRESVKKI